MTNPLIFSGVTKRFQDLSVLQDFSYTFEAGRRYCLMGPSGCGKSTLLRLACGLELPDNGSISGADAAFCYVFQENRLLPWETAAGNIALTCRRETPAFWLDALGIGDFGDALPAALSGGMRRRTAIARALAADGEIYLFDEAFTGLDATRKAEVMALILQYTAGKTCLFTTHDPAEAAALGGEILQFEGPPLTLR